MEYKFIEKLQPQQAGIISDFMSSLENNDIELFWNSLSKEDKAHLKGAYKMLSKLNEEFDSFDQWMGECFEASKVFFSDYLNNYGVSTSVRYENKLVGNVLLPKNIETNITFLQDTEAVVIRVPLILETDVSNDESIIGSWKVYLFSNDNVEAPF